MKSFDEQVKSLYSKGALLMLGVSIVIIILSMTLMIWGLILFFGEFIGPDHRFTLDLLLKPLELAFLAPLPYLIYNGACRMLADLIPKFGAQSPFTDITPATERNLEFSKCLVAGLIIGVFATDSLRCALSDGGLSKESALAHAIVILALTAFIGIVKPRHHGNKTDQTDQTDRRGNAATQPDDTKS